MIGLREIEISIQAADDADYLFLGWGSKLYYREFPYSHSRPTNKKVSRIVSNTPLGSAVPFRSKPANWY